MYPAYAVAPRPRYGRVSAISQGPRQPSPPAPLPGERGVEPDATRYVRHSSEAGVQRCAQATRCGWVARVVMPSPSAGSRQAPPRHLSGRSRPLCQAASAPPRPSRRRGLGSPVVLPGTFWDILRHSTPATRSRVEAGPPTLSAGGALSPTSVRGRSATAEGAGVTR